MKTNGLVIERATPRPWNYATTGETMRSYTQPIGIAQRGAMRKVCLGVIHFDKHGHADTLEKAIEDAKTALALAEGKAVQS